MWGGCARFALTHKTYLELDFCHGADPWSDRYLLQKPGLLQLLVGLLCFPRIQGIQAFTACTACFVVKVKKCSKVQKHFWDL